jgi:hypothetical protein
MPRAGRHGIRFSFTQRGECTRPQNRRADNDRLTGADAHTIPQLSTDSSTRLAAIKPDSRRVSQKTFWEFAAQMLPTGKGSLCKLLKRWWTWSGSNRRPLPCHGSALPAAPQAHSSTSLFSLTGVHSSNQRCYGTSNKKGLFPIKGFFFNPWNQLPEFSSCIKEEGKL